MFTIPLVVLAVLAVVGGVLNLPFSSDLHLLEHWLEPVLEGNEAHLGLSTGAKWAIGVISALGALAGIAAGTAIYWQRRREPVEPALLRDAWRIDAAYSWFMGGPGRQIFQLVTDFDRVVVDGAVNGVGTVVRRAGATIRPLQSGFVRSYAVGVAGGAVVLVVFFLVRLIQGDTL